MPAWVLLLSVYQKAGGGGRERLVGGRGCNVVSGEEG